MYFDDYYQEERYEHFVTLIGFISAQYPVEGDEYSELLVDIELAFSEGEITEMQYNDLLEYLEIPKSGLLM